MSTERRRHTLREWTPFVLVLSSALLAGCLEPTNVQGQEPLREVEIAEDFKFKTARSVRVELVADPVLERYGPLSVDISLPGGNRIYQGPLRSDGTLSVDLGIPTKDQSLDIHVKGENKEIDQTVTIQDGVVREVLREQS